MVSVMSKSPSNRALLIEDLRAIAIRYREKPSTLFAEFESFLDSQGIGIGQHRRKIEKAKERDTDLLRQIFEERADFPGWDAL